MGTKTGWGSSSQRWLARYNYWSQYAQWEWSKYHFPRNRNKITANRAQAKPFIICISASEYYEYSFRGGRMNDGQRVYACTHQPGQRVFLFTVRMMAYMFGDEEKDSRHESYNAYKSIGQQYYMNLDSNNMQNIGFEKQKGQHAVMTSNCMFDVDSFTIWDFFTKQFYQDHNGCYCLYEPSCMSKSPWKW